MNIKGKTDHKNELTDFIYAGNEKLSSIIHGLGQVLKAIFHIIGFFCKN